MFTVVGSVYRRFKWSCLIDAHVRAWRIPTVCMLMLNGCSRPCMAYAGPLVLKFEFDVPGRGWNTPTVDMECGMVVHGRIWRMPAIDMEMLN